VAAWAGLGAGASLLPASVLAQQDDGVRQQVGRESKFTQLVPAEQVEQAAQQQYVQLKKEAQGKRALAPDSHPR
jgi:uncharacterized spore protein YtfJ